MNKSMSVHISSLKFLYSNLFSETSQMPEANDDRGLVDDKKNSDEIGSHLCIENREIQPVPDDLEALEEDSVKTRNIVLLTEPVQGLGDVGETKEGIGVIITAPCEEDCSTTPQSETNDPVLELDSKQSEEPGLIQESDPPQPGVPPDFVCDSVEAVETEDSENVELTIIANDETPELENAETFVEMQESVLEVKQEEPTCEEQIESTVEVEFHGHKEQLIQQSVCSDELENSEASKQALSLDEELLEGTKQSSYNETETSDQASQTKCTVDVETSQTKTPSETELLDQSERSAETETSQLSESKDSKETNQPDKLQQTEQENHTNSEQRDKDSVRQTEDVSSEHVHVAEEQQEESVEPTVPYKNRNVEVVDREEACKLAERLYRLDNVQRTDVVRHLDKE